MGMYDDSLSLWLADVSVHDLFMQPVHGVRRWCQRRQQVQSELSTKLWGMQGPVRSNNTPALPPICLSLVLPTQNNRHLRILGARPPLELGECRRPGIREKQSQRLPC